MFTLVASDDPTIATRLRHALARHGHDCPLSCVVAIDDTAERPADSNDPQDLILFVLPDDQQRGLRRLGELRRRTTARIVVFGRSADGHSVLDAMHAGADDFLDQGGELHEQLAGALERLHARKLPAQDAPGKLLVVTGASGGSGASFVASNLAVLAARQHACGLVDLDLRQGVQAALLDVKPRHTIADLCRNLEKIDANMLRRSLIEHASGIRVLAAPHQIAEAPELTPEGIRRVLRLMRSMFPHVVVDQADCYDAGSNGVVQAADALLVVFRLDLPSLRSLRRLLEFWEESGVAAGKVHLIANRCGAPTDIPVARLASALRRPVTHFIPDDCGPVNLSANCGSPLVLESPRSQAARALTRIAEELAIACRPEACRARWTRPWEWLSLQAAGLRSRMTWPRWTRALG